MKYYVTSDAHGFYTPLREALANAGYFDDDAPHKLLIVGDLFDRGGEATALQLTGIDPAFALAAAIGFAKAVRETPYYQKILPAMIEYYELKNCKMS